MRTRSLQGLLAAGALVAGTLLFGLPAGAQTPPDTDPAIARCLDEGGSWQTSSLSGSSCVRPTTDAGRACTDDAQCQGLCVPGDDAYGEPGCSNDGGVIVCSKRRPLLARAGDPLKGVCAATHRDAQPTRCEKHVVDGKLVIDPCAD